MTKTFDFIIVGAGSAGCVLANRLSINPAHQVLLIENGPDDRSQKFVVDMPKGFGKLLADTKMAYHYVTGFPRPPGYTPDRWARGKLLGGSSSVNGMVWMKGQPEDYDRLVELGNPGWGWSDMLRCFKLIENHELGEDEMRGIGGPIDITTHPKRSRLCEAVIAAGESVGLPRKLDQNQRQHEGIGYLQSNITKRRRRVSAARAFLDPIRRHRKNLSIVTGTRADKILFEGKRAIGVRCLGDGVIVEYRLSAGGEIILSAGAIQSPKILQHSGVGPGNHLRSLDIDVIQDSPGVGRNMREHRTLFMQYDLKNWSDSYNNQFAGLRLIKNVLKYKIFATGPMGFASQEVGAHMKIMPDATRPDTQLIYGPYSLNLDDGHKRDNLTFDDHPGLHLLPFALRPTSQGTIMIDSPDPSAPVRINPNYLSTDYDRKIAIGSVRYVRKLMQQAPLKPFILRESRYTSDSRTDDQILDVFERHGQAGYHASGTAKMGQDEMAVLDARLRVRGIEGVRVMDCSICPEIIAANTNAPMIGMAWRASEIVLEDRR